MEKPPIAPGIAPVPSGTPTENLQGRAFIGGKSSEFKQNHPPPKAEIKQEEPKVEKVEEPEERLCNVCSGNLPEEASYCPTCGIDLKSKDIIKALRIELSEEDISEYLFKGYLVKEIPLVGDKKAVFKTLVPSESEKIEEELVGRFGDGPISNILYQNTLAILTLSHGWIKFDGFSLGENAEKRTERLKNSIGGHLIDIANRKWNLFNRAISAMLEDPDILKN